MRLEPVPLARLRVKLQCCKCKEFVVLGDRYEGHLWLWGLKRTLYADLDGEAFKAYYCRDCAASVQPSMFIFGPVTHLERVPGS